MIIMIDWTIVGITFVGLIIVIAGIYYTIVLIGKMMDFYIKLKKEIEQYF